MSEMADQPANVLIVDDEESVRRYVDRILTTGGYRTRVALDCADAIAAASLARFDLLLTDVMMPEMSGAQLAATLRQADPELKVLYLTGYADQLFTEKPPTPLDPQEAFLEKPCTAASLRQAVSLALTGCISMTAARVIDVALRHNLLNQLAIIRGFADILLGEAAAGDPRRPDFALIQTAARTAIDLLGGVPDQETL